MAGRPVYKPALRASEEDWLALTKGPNVLDDEENLKAFEAYIACAEKFADMANAYVIRDNQINQFIKDEVTLYFAGTKSAKDAAAAIQNKVNLYLSE